MLTILATHPIQYQVPIWQQLSQNGRVPFEVWYLTAHGVEASHDKEFGRSIQWDFPILEGYPYRFGSDPVRGQLGGFWRIGLGGELRARLTNGPVKAVLVQGWNVRAFWEAIHLAHRSGIHVWIRGDSNDLKVDRRLLRITKRLLLRRLFCRVDRFLYVGEANRRLYRRYGICKDRLISAPNCVDNSRFSAQARALLPLRQVLRHAWGIPDGAFCLLYAAKFIPKKRPLDVVESVRLLGRADFHRSYHILFVGSGLLGRLVRQQCHVVFDAEEDDVPSRPRTASSPSASFTGFLNQSEIAKAYIAADALVLASDADETWGLVVNEAMACGLPAIVSNACGAAEDLVIPLEPHLSYPCGDVSALADSIRWLADHPISASAIAERIARYDISATVDTLERLWSEITAQD